MFIAAANSARSRHWLPIFLVALLLAGLPAAVWLDLRNLSESSLQVQAKDLNSVITGVRTYYAQNVVNRVLSTSGHSEVVHNYKDIPGAIPIPATLSLELGKVIGEQQSNITYRFVSDYPFKGRAPHELDDFERKALLHKPRPGQPAKTDGMPTMTDTPTPESSGAPQVVAFGKPAARPDAVRPRVLGIANQKGGVGKTTSAFLLSTALAKLYDVTVIDADPNHPIKTWASGGNTPRQVLLIADLSARILCCTPSYALHIADTIAGSGIDPREQAQKQQEVAKW